MSKHFDKWMAAEFKAHRLREELEAARKELHDTRPRCWAPTPTGQCGGKALPSGLCAAHEYDATC